MKPRIDYNMLFVGDPAVGKTSIVESFKYSTFNRKNYLETIGLCLIHDTVEFEDYIVDITFWDTAGQRIYRRITPKYLHTRHIDSVAVIYDLTRIKTLKSAIKWMQRIKKQDDNIFIGLIGNKMDLRYNKRIIIKNIEKYNNFGKAYHYFVSAKRQNGIEQTIYDILSQDLVTKLKNKKPQITNEVTV